MLAFGKNTLFMTEPKKIKKVYVHKGKSDFSLFQYLKENHIPYILVEGNLLNKMCKQNHQGIVFEREEYSYHSLDSILDKDFLVLLDHIEILTYFTQIRDEFAVDSYNRSKTRVSAINNVHFVS